MVDADEEEGAEADAAGVEAGHAVADPGRLRAHREVADDLAEQQRLRYPQHALLQIYLEKV